MDGPEESMVVGTGFVQVNDDHVPVSYRQLDVYKRQLYNFVESLLGPRRTRKYFWYFGTIFTIILVSNYMGLLPGVCLLYTSRCV